MYRIYKGNIPIYDLRDDELIVVNPNLDLEVNKLGSLSFNIYPSHPYFDVLTKRSTVLSVYKDDKIIYKGYIISDEQGLYNDKKIECEGVLGYLNDSMVRPYTFSGTPEQHFKNLLNGHNSQVAEHQQLKIGTITVTDPNDYIVRSSVNYASTWDILNEDLINKLGGYLRVRYETDGTYVDYLADFDDTSTQVIEFGENLIDVLVKNNAADVYTAVIPLGAEIDNNGTTERLTIKSVNNDLDYLVNQESYNKYGLIFAPVDLTTWDDVTVPTNLKTKGTNFLNNEAVMLKSSLEVSAIDLNVTDDDIEAFFIYEYIRFISSVHNINQKYLLQKISIPMDKPQDMKITLGKEVNSLTGIQMGNKQNVDKVIERINIVEKNYELNEAKTDEKMNDLRNEVQTNLTSIQQNTDEIIMTALKDYVATSDYETFKETISTIITQTNEDITFSFNSLQQIITNMDENIQNQFQEQSKYIRFDGGISMGETGSEVTLRIENDIIKFVVSNTSVLEITPNGIIAPKIKTNEVEYTPFRLYVETDGSLTLDMVGDN